MPDSEHDTQPDSPICSLFPDNVTTFFSRQRPADAALLGVEKELSGKMAEKRLNEFVHGRYCARRAMQAASFPPVAIGKGEKREPLWPDNITGSITHTGPFAAAAIAHSSDFAGLGLDIETAKPLEEKLFKAICLPEEIALFKPGSAGDEAKLLFSIKESIYKCLWPSVRSFIDFTEMQVLLNADGVSYQAIPHTEKCPPALSEKLQGRYVRTDELVLSSAWIAQD